MAVSDEELIQILKYGRCKCGNIAEKPHTCPLASEIYGDDETKCNCCPKCEQDCIDDI